MSNEWIERIVHSEIIDRTIFIITSPSILIELVDPCKLLGGLINSVKKVCHRLVWTQTSFDAKCRGFTLGCWLISRFCLLFLMNCWHSSSSVLKDSGTGRGYFGQRKIDSMPCIIWVCRVLLCQDQGGQGGTCPALKQDETWLSQGSLTSLTIRVF